MSWMHLSFLLCPSLSLGRSEQRRRWRWRSEEGLLYMASMGRWGGWHKNGYYAVKEEKVKGGFWCSSCCRLRTWWWFIEHVQISLIEKTIAVHKMVCDLQVGHGDHCDLWLTLLSKLKGAEVLRVTTEFTMVWNSQWYWHDRRKHAHKTWDARSLPLTIFFFAGSSRICSLGQDTSPS